MSALPRHLLAILLGVPLLLMTACQAGPIAESPSPAPAPPPPSAPAQATEEPPGDAAAEAKADIAAGILRIKTYGLVAGNFEKYRQLLHEDYGIELKTVAGCVVAEIAELHAYNQVMRAEIARRFGPDALEDAARRASEKLLERRAATQ